MAKAGPIVLPPSLADDYRRLVRTWNGVAPDSTLAAIQPTARTTSRETYISQKTRIASNAANWLADRWTQPKDLYGRSHFYAQRLTEIRNNEFPAEFWHVCPLLANRTQYAEPTVLPFLGAQDPNYYDPQRIATQSAWGDFTADYATPGTPQDPPDPSPGWYGAISDDYWSDRWLAQQALSYALPVAFSHLSPRPVIFRLAVAIDAESSIRGNRAWFTLQHFVQFHTAEGAPPSSRMLTWYERNWLYHHPIPEDMPGGWAHGASYHTTRDPGPGYRGAPGESWNRCQITLSVPPSQGRYFSRNDFARIRFSVVPDAYLARAPQD